MKGLRPFKLSILCLPGKGTGSNRLRDCSSRRAGRRCGFQSGVSPLITPSAAPCAACRRPFGVSAFGLIRRINRRTPWQAAPGASLVRSLCMGMQVSGLPGFGPLGLSRGPSVPKGFPYGGCEGPENRPVACFQRTAGRQALVVDRIWARRMRSLLWSFPPPRLSF